MTNTPIIDGVIEELKAKGIEFNILYPHVRKNKKQLQKSNTYVLKNEYSTRKIILRIKDMEGNIWII